MPALEAIIRVSAGHGVEEVVFGMPHRGRINILTTVMGKPYIHVFSEFQGGASTPEDVLGSGDVKYHLGTSTDRELPDGRKIHLSMTPNPSHLEWVNPVVMGRVRAKQGVIGDAKHKRVMSVLMHGDAAFAGQGIVAETLGMSELRGHRTGGTLHIIVNNQIGFTTSPKYSRSSPYPSDVAKMVQAPIIHVNGDNPEAVVHAATLAADFRHQFGRDVVLDIFCYRRYGHNEADEPAFTQPLMYKRDRRDADHPRLYTEKLVGEGVLTAPEADKRLKSFQEMLAKAFEEARDYSPQKADWLEGEWAGFTVAPEGDRRGKTGVAMTAAARSRRGAMPLSRGVQRPPQDRSIPRSAAQGDRDRRGHRLGDGGGMAFGTLLTDGHTVRLSGQDSGRGTFLPTPFVLVDQKTEERHIPLNFLSEDQAHFDVTDSLLSEAAVLGYEYGYTSPIPIRWSCGRRSSAISPTPRKSSSISSSAPAKANGCACRGWFCCCRMAMRARDRSTARRGWSAICNCSPRTISRSRIAPRRLIISTCCAANCIASSANR